MNVNTLDEVPDSSWFTNRIGRHDIPIADLVRGPDQRDGRDLDSTGGSSRGGKGSGVQPGFRMTTIRPGSSIRSKSIRRVIPSWPRGAEIIGTAFYYAFGYHTVEVYSGRVRRRVAGDLREGHDSRSVTRQAAPVHAPRSRRLVFRGRHS